MAVKDNTAEDDGRAKSAREQLIAVVGEQRYQADWTNNRHRARRLFSEFIGTFGLLFVLSAGAGPITARPGAPIGKGTPVAPLSLNSALLPRAGTFPPVERSPPFHPALHICVRPP